jgi:phosphopantetheinyl transferase (holo-ACP synthase)
MGIILKRHISESAIVGLWEITETVDELFSNVHLNEEENTLFKGFSNDLRKLHWLSYRNLLKELISTEEYSHVIYDEFGKPYLQYNSHHLSVSHAGKYSAAIVNKNSPVGIDIEKTLPRIHKITHKFLSEKELKNIPPENNTDSLYVCWGAKEALYKLYGKQELLFQENILLNPFVYSETGFITGTISINDFTQEYKLYYEKMQDYMLVYTADC